MKVGLQMYSVRNEMAKDPIGTTAAVLDLGYRYIEFANLTPGDTGIGYDANPDELKSLFAATESRPVSTHLLGIGDDFQQVIEYHKALGTQYLVSKFFYRNLDDIVDMADQFVRLGDAFAEAGIGHLIHTGLLRRDGDRTDLDELLDRVPAELLSVELDTYWLYRCGLDPIELMKRHGDRIRIIHQKDMPAEISDPVDIVAALPEDTPLLPQNYYFEPYVSPGDFIEVGQGTLPLQQIIDTANEYCRSEYLFVEQDFTSLAELESVSQSLQGLQHRSGLTFAA